MKKQTLFCLIVAGISLIILIAILTLPKKSTAVRLEPPDSTLGGEIELSYVKYTPPIWMKGSQNVQGETDVPWMPGAKAGFVKAGDPVGNVKPFATAAFMKHDFSLEAYRTGQTAIADRPNDFESTVFHAIDVTCAAGRFMIVVGVEFVSTSPSQAESLSCSLYELQNGKRLMTSARQHSPHSSPFHGNTWIK